MIVKEDVLSWGCTIDLVGNCYKITVATIIDGEMWAGSLPVRLGDDPIAIIKILSDDMNAALKGMNGK